jgi:hypothetical protein
MGWKEVDNKLIRGLKDSSKVACSEDWERETVKETIAEEFPNLKESVIEDAIDHCCDVVRPPRPREDFLACLKRELS